MPKTIYTIGHSNHDMEHFILLLKQYDINCIADIRSTPYSSYNKHFNKKNIRNVLLKNNIYYIYMGDQLGAKYDDSSLLDDNLRVDFEKVRKTTKFKEGINRLKLGLEGEYKIAIMCSEKNPIDCHRSILVSYSLAKNNIKVVHIINKNKTIEHEQIEKRLKEIYKKEWQQISFFNKPNNEKLLDYAYEKHNKEIAYELDKQKHKGMN